MIFFLGLLIMATFVGVLLWLPLRAIAVLPKLLLLSIIFGVTALIYMRLGALPATLRWEAQTRVDEYYAEVMSHLGTTKESVIHTISVLNQRLQEHPEEAQGWYLLGQIALGVGDRPSAEFYLQRAHELAPDNNDFTEAVNALTQHQKLIIKLTNIKRITQQFEQQHFTTLFVAIKQKGESMPLWVYKQTLNGKMPEELRLDAERNALAGRSLPIQQPLSITLRLSHGEQLDVTVLNSHDWVLAHDFVIAPNNPSSIELMLDLSLIIIK